jgi:predicted GNAT family acetyltransferase
MDYTANQLINNTAIHNFELFVDGQRAFIDYKQKDDKVYLIHTEVPTALEGRGVAAAIVEKTFRYMEEHHLKLVPLCVYVKHYLTVHPEWNRLLA